VAMSLLEKEEIARAILGYLARNPKAQDTLPGIIEWWLLDHQIRTRTAEIKRVIDELVAEKLILKRRGADLQHHYCINPRRQRRIAALIVERANFRSLKASHGRGDS
jgi:hypothetical protein